MGFDSVLVFGLSGLGWFWVFFWCSVGFGFRLAFILVRGRSFSRGLLEFSLAFELLFLFARFIFVRFVVVFLLFGFVL